MEKLELTDNALQVLERRYLRRNSEGIVIEDPTEMFERVARFIAEADRNYGATQPDVDATADRFLEMMTTLKFLPNSPTLMNAGREKGQLSACFVLPVGDSMEEIFETNKHSALIHKSGGGTGFSFSRLRARNSIVASTSGIASGPVSFMRVFDASTDAVKQGGTRRGANMGVLRIDHPDIIEFIRCKENHGEITNFNISVGVTDQFMEALESDSEYPLIDPRTKKIYEIDDKQSFMKASTVWDLIIDHAWNNGEPGVVFLDRMDRLNPTSPTERIEATNPCGEQPLPPYDSCNLGSINLGLFVTDDTTPSVDWGSLEKTVTTAVHFLDNVIDRNHYPIIQIKEQTLKNRRIGLGVMGWADMLVKLGLPYNSEKAFSLASEITLFVQRVGREASSELVRTRGKFPSWDGSVYRLDNLAMRNATITTVAPTGTISIIAGCSSGIEPYFSLVYERNVMDGTRLLEKNELFAGALEAEVSFADSLWDEIASERSIADMDQIPESIRKLFVTAVDISPEDHIRMQAAFQEGSDSSVSKTINFAEDASIADVKAAFELAYKSGCKGITVYRDRSRPDQVLNTVSIQTIVEPEIDKTKIEVAKHSVIARPALLSGFTEKIKTGFGNLYVTVNLKDGLPFEVFAQIGKSGYSTMADTEAICRLISLSLRSSVPVSKVISQIRGIGGSVPVFSSGGRVASIPDAIAQVLSRHFGTDKSSENRPIASEKDICPECGAAMIFDSGCYLCYDCAYSSC